MAYNEELINMILRYLLTLKSFYLYSAEGTYMLNAIVEDFDASIWENQHGNQL